MGLNNLVTRTGETIVTDDLTVFVGPNNTGKTQTLNDIESYYTNSTSDRPIIRSADIDIPSSLNELQRELNLNDHPTMAGQRVVQGLSSDLRSPQNPPSFNDSTVENWIRTGRSDNLLKSLGQFFIANIDASSRLSIASSTTSFDAQEGTPGNLVQSLYISEDDIIDSLQSAFQETFGMEIRLDYSALLKTEDGGGITP